jgi:hypothetical protein
VQIHEYLHTNHIRDARNFLADKIRRNPAGVNKGEVKELSRPRAFIVAAVNLGIDPAIGNKLGELATYQIPDQGMQI